MAEAELSYQQRLAQMPLDVLPTMHFVSQLPGMESREKIEVREGLFSEKQRFWFGKTIMNGEEVVLGIVSGGIGTNFMIAGERGGENWEMNESNCSFLRFARTDVVHKSLLVQNELTPRDVVNADYRFSLALNFCSGSTAYCDSCILKDDINEELRPTGEWTSRSLINPYSKEPSEFPMRRISDIVDSPDRFSRRSRERGFGSVEKALEVMGQLKQGIMDAEQITTKRATEMYPDVVHPLTFGFCKTERLDAIESK